jgi:membrane associated rhomboid family serine protease
MKNNITFSNFLIILSIIFTVIWYFDPRFIQEWSINNYYNKNLLHYFLQFFSWTFIHWWIFHLFFNSIFIFYFGNILEIIMKKKKYISFFLFSTVFIGLSLTNFTNDLTIWISGFAMSLLTYYTLELKSLNNPEYKWGITAIIVNLAIWLYPWISLWWHFFWVIAWIIFYFITNDFFKRQFIGLFKYFKINSPTKNLNPLSSKKN